MKPTAFLYTYYFPIISLVAITIYTLQQLEIHLPAIIENYVNDFLCMPIILHICQFTVRKLKSDPCITLPFPLIMIVTLGYALYFEWYLPKHTIRYTADWMDVFLYFLGAIFFCGIALDKKRISVVSTEIGK
ncbi:hypothetical protein [Aquimarina sp. SS2-1]|uniref:hypothetical protein n=1 Tax=Aquimarina besae TaxID=3342247 RepID=UPI00366E20F8